MLPSSALGVAVLLCLIPGLLYVRMVEPTRHPRDSSPLLDGVEVLARGLLAIGFVVVPWTLLSPDGVKDFLREPGEDPRRLAYVVALLVLGSGAAAYVMARGRIARLPSRYTPTVWTKTFDEFRAGYVREALVEVIGGRAYQGTLLAYTLDPAVEQQITLSESIWRVDGENPERLLPERMTFMGSQITSVSMQYTPDGAEADRAVERGWIRKHRDTAWHARLAAHVEWTRREPTTLASAPESSRD